MRQAWTQTFRKQLLTRAVWQRTTPRRLRNLLRAETARRRGATRLDSSPVTVMLAPTSACNLRCPFCFVGQGSSGRPDAAIGVEDYRSLVDAVAADAYCMQLYVYGEPTLHPRLPALVALAADRNMYTSTSTNATLVDPPLAEALVASGLDHVVVSIDGATQDSYATYRRGGHLEDAVRGVRHLVAARRALGARRPLIEWRTIVFRHNEHELADVRSLATGAGADVFRLVPGYVQDPAWAATDPRFRTTAYQYASQSADGCQWPYRRLVVHADGGISPCCWAYPAPFDFGHVRDIGTHGLPAVWNNAAYRASRAAIAGRAQERADQAWRDPGADQARRDPGADQARPDPEADQARRDPEAAPADGGRAAPIGPATVCVRCREGIPPSSWNPESAAALIHGRTNR